MIDEHLRFQSTHIALKAQAILITFKTLFVAINDKLHSIAFVLFPLTVKAICLTTDVRRIWLQILVGHSPMPTVICRSDVFYYRFIQSFFYLLVIFSCPG